MDICRGLLGSRPRNVSGFWTVRIVLALGEAANPDSLFVCRHCCVGFAHPYVLISSTTNRLSLMTYHRSHVGIRESQSNEDLSIADCGLRIADCGFIESETLAVLRILSHKKVHLLSIRNPQSAIRNPQSEDPQFSSSTKSFCSQSYRQDLSRRI